MIRGHLGQVLPLLLAWCLCGHAYTPREHRHRYDLRAHHAPSEILRELQEADRFKDLAKYNKESHKLNKWLNLTDRLLAISNNELSIAEYNYETDICPQTSKQFQAAQLKASKLGKKLAVKAAKWKKDLPKGFHDRMAKRMLDFLATTATLTNKEELAWLTNLTTKMSGMYASAKVEKNGKLYSGEPDLEEIMSTSHDYDQLLWAWQGWRNVTGPDIRPLYQKAVKLMNKGAIEHEYEDMGAYWKESHFEESKMTEPLETLVDRLWTEVKPLYQQLHAYVRRKLYDFYKGRGQSLTGPIPAHILGNMWAQEWTSLLDLVKPFSSVASPDVTSEMKQKKFTALDMFKLAESFFTSIGLEPMTADFWRKSMIEQPKGKTVQCHASASDFFNQHDFRIKMCTHITMDDLITIHHEMGHIEYFMQYRNQPQLFRSGANSAFHEAIGDTIALSVMTPEHLTTIKLLKACSTCSKEQRHQQDINFLMKMALEKIAFLPFGLLIDKWRWGVFKGTITNLDYNSKWWQLRLKYQGIKPPVARSENDFDPAAKFHVADNVPYIRYFLSFIGQFQFHKSLCQAAGHKGPMHQCDIYKSKAAGKKLKATLKLGASKRWSHAMHKMTGQHTFKSDAILEYFKPLKQWLEKENKKNKEHIGWTESLEEMLDDS